MDRSIVMYIRICNVRWKRSFWIIWETFVILKCCNRKTGTLCKTRKRYILLEAEFVKLSLYTLFCKLTELQ